jgi:glycosyltransferase involved in cell wall biosynthesis
MALIVHEAFVPITDARSLVMGTWQRGQLRAVSAGVDFVFHVVEDRVQRLAGAWPRRPTEYLAVGANVPDARAERMVVRSAHGWSDDTIVIATLGGPHPSKLQGWIAPAIEAVAALGRPACHADLGSQPIGVRVPGVARLAPGYLEADALAGHLAAADLFLAPYDDGISGRRGSVMAALRNGVAVVSTVDDYSDRLLSSPDSGLTLVGTDDRGGFARAVRDLAEDDVSRRDRARAGRALYEERLDWPVIVRRLAEVPETLTPRGGHDTSSAARRGPGTG